MKGRELREVSGDKFFAFLIFDYSQRRTAKDFCSRLSIF